METGPGSKTKSRKFHSPRFDLTFSPTEKRNVCEGSLSQLQNSDASDASQRCELLLNSPTIIMNVATR